MGAKTWMFVVAEGNAREILAACSVLDCTLTAQTAIDLFPREKLEPLIDGSLSWTCPPDDEIYIGCFSGLTIIAAKEFGVARPSQLEKRFLDYAGSRTAILHAMHSVVGWFAFALWRDGKLQRSLSLAPDDGIIEEIGSPLLFETPYWSGAHPAVDPQDIEDGEPSYPFPFHPLELGEAALREFFGYQLEGYIDPSLIDTDAIPLMRYKRKKARRILGFNLSRLRLLLK